VGGKNEQIPTLSCHFKLISHEKNSINKIYYGIRITKCLCTSAVQALPGWQVHRPGQASLALYGGVFICGQSLLFLGAG
jgi:hypothetical protein